MDRAIDTEVPRRRGASDFSYKFQRLREAIREAVAKGEFNGKLPGERELARRFRVNAKTLSKALTDLAAEGLLSRSIGRGTFVKSAAEEQQSTQEPWLLICPPDQIVSPLVDALRRRNPEIKTVSEVMDLRPSFLNQFGAVVDLSDFTPDAFLRDLIVRNTPVVVVGRQPRVYATSAVILDVAYLAGRLARDLFLDGHRRLTAVESLDRSTISDGSSVWRSLRAAASRFSPEAVIDRCFPRQAAGKVESGVTAFFCDSPSIAREVLETLTASSVDVPNSASIVCAASAEDTERCCSGFYSSADQEAEAIAHLLTQGQSTSGGSILWLTGTYMDRGTTAAASSGKVQRPLMTLTA